MASFPVGHFNMLVRKRPGIDPVIHPQPLDLSISKQKVRHHWSGGSIVEVNEAIPTSMTLDQSSQKSTSMALVTLCSLPSSRLTDLRSVSCIPATPQGSCLDQPPGSKRNRISKLMDDTVVENDLQRLSAGQLQLRLSGYYYPYLSSNEATQMLQHTPVGTFLLRDSSDSHCLYALSIQTKAGPTSVRIRYVDGYFRLDANNSCVASDLPHFRSVPELVDFYVSKWRTCKERGQVWLDNRGKIHSNITLKRPAIRSSPTLQHLCRLSWNRSLRSLPPDDVPSRIQSFLKEYPFCN